MKRERKEWVGEKGSVRKKEKKPSDECTAQARDEEKGG